MRSRGRFENRNQEISAISCGFKLLFGIELCRCWVWLSYWTNRAILQGLDIDVPAVMIGGVR